MKQQIFLLAVCCIGLSAAVAADKVFHDFKGKVDLIIAKQRNGPVGTIKLAFVHEYTRFENAELVRQEEMA